ncbi:MAG TPA: NAD(P)H-binding protein, partial [Solirubrobacteraceae bacterium]|nr:NAD(P)H-binding protein [Solirubrobacteraceae bacterium]
GCDAVVSAVGGAKAGAPRVVVDAAPALIEGLRQANVTRLLVVGGAGGLRAPEGGRVVDRPSFREDWKPAALAQIDALETLRRDGGELDWTFVAPADVIEPGERTGRYGTSTDDLVVDAHGESFISAEDYAVALVDELERPRALRERLAVGPARG